MPILFVTTVLIIVWTLHRWRAKCVVRDWAEDRCFKIDKMRLPLIGGGPFFWGGMSHNQACKIEGSRNGKEETKWLLVNLFTGSVKEHKKARRRKTAAEKTRRHLLGVLGVGLALLAGYLIFGRRLCVCAASDLSAPLMAIGLSVTLVLTGLAFLHKAPTWCWILLSLFIFALFAFSHPLAEAVLGRWPQPRHARQMQRMRGQQVARLTD